LFNFILASASLVSLFFFLGVKYIQDRFKGNCTWTTVDAFGVDGTTDGTYVSLRDPEAFFDFDKGNFHYVGVVC
jgi:hypothetical protein